MSEVKSRPSGPRSRGSGRAGRGGFTSRGRGGRSQASGSKMEPSPPSFEDEGEIGQLKSKFSAQLAMIKEMFPDWTDEDIVFALAETDGDLEGTINRITEGNVSQWGEVKKKTKDRSQSKPKETPAPPVEGSSQSTRGGRGRGGADVPRGGRGRGSDRGRATARGGRGTRGSVAPRVNGHTSDSKGYGDAAITDKAVGDWSAASPETDSNALDSSWEHVTQESAQPAPEEEKPAPTNSAPKTWASIFAPKPAPPKKASQAAPTHDAPVEPPIPTIAAPTDNIQGLPPPLSTDPTSEIPNTPPSSDFATSEQATDITPPKDDLTKTNLEKLPDTTEPVASATAASTVASTIDHRTISGTPSGFAPQQAGRPPLGGFATTAYKATGMPGRSTSYQRKILEQQEAVVMPGKHAVDKAAVQFGSMGLTGTPEDVDVDSDREDAETRAQPPQHSPVAPRASLPPAPHQQQQELPSPPAVENPSLPRPAPGLPPVSQPPLTQQSLQQSTGESQPSISSTLPYNQYGDRYGQSASQSESTASVQKPYEPFGQQLQQSQQYDPFGGNSSQQLSNEARQYGMDKYGSGAGNTSSYYTSDEQRNAFQSHYGGYGQQQQQPGQDSSLSQPRTSSAIGTSAPGQPPQQASVQSRFGQTSEPHNSGHSTPYGTMSSQQPTNPAHSSAPGQHGGYGYGGYPYGNYYSNYMNQMHNQPYSRDRPMYDDNRRFEDQYMAQSPGFGYGGGQSGFGGGGPFGGAGGKSLYGQQHPGYGVTPQTSHDQHSASPANAGAFGQQLPGSGRDSGAPGLSHYGARAGSTQPDTLHSTNQSSLPDVFGRSQSGFQGQSQSHTSGPDDPLRGYGDSSKIPGGPSPALGQSGGRPGSAVNPQTGLPTQDARFSAGGYSGYPGHSQYGGGPGAGGHQSAQAGHQGYGGYGGGYGGSYYGNSNRGGWGASYGH